MLQALGCVQALQRKNALTAPIEYARLGRSHDFKRRYSFKRSNFKRRNEKRRCNPVLPR